MEFYTISVLTQDSITKPEQMYQFLRSLRSRRICLNVEEEEGVNKSSLQDDLSKSAKIYSHFMQRVYELASDEENINIVREFHNFHRSLTAISKGRRRAFLSQQTRPLGIITIDSKGDFSTFSPELLSQKHDYYGDFIFGNVH